MCNIVYVYFFISGIEFGLFGWKLGILIIRLYGILICDYCGVFCCKVIRYFYVILILICLGVFYLIIFCVRVDVVNKFS